MKRYILTSVLAVAFFGVLAVFALAADSDAREIREGVFRFHVVASSDSDTDQQNKLAVRDGLAELCSELFGSASGKDEAMQKARNSLDSIEQKAEQILLSRGCDDSVTATVTQRFFPTRRYDGVSLPAGVYDTLDIKIGEGDGKNFWCVMFPDICIGATDADRNRRELAGVLDGGSYDMATDSDAPVVRFKFKTVELIQSLKNFFHL